MTASTERPGEEGNSPTSEAREEASDSSDNEEDRWRPPSDPPGSEKDLDSRLSILDSSVSTLDSSVSTLDSSVTHLHSRLASLENRKRLPRFVAVLITVVVGLVAAFGVGRITATDDDPGQAAPVALPVASTATTGPPATEAPTSSVLPTTTGPTLPPATSPPEPSSTTGPPTTLQPPGRSVAEIAASAGPGVVQIETQSALGSGIIYDERGLILTAAHVVDSADDFVTVRLADGRAVEGEIVGAHAPTDVAVIKIEPIEGMQTIELAPADSIVIGELAVALGSPFGLEQTVTAGIVSAVDRLVNGVIMVQTDAAINPGNSGGPLVDELGRVIGINDQIFTLGGGNEGVGFAISIDLAILIAEQIVAGDEIQLAFLGVTVSPSDGDPPGALVEQVVSGSAADASGLQEGDLIVSADGRLIINSDALRARVIKKRPGDTVELQIVRDGEALTLSAVLGSTAA